MSRVFFAAACIILITDAALIVGQEHAKNKPTVEEALAKYVAIGPGVQVVKKDKRGRVTSLVVVGNSRISTVLGKEKGLEIARERARLECSAAFVRWLKEKASIFSSSSEEDVVLMEGTESADANTKSEFGKAVDKNSKKMESVSEGIVRGLQPIHAETDGEGKTFSLVMGWKADTAEAVKKLAASLASDETAKPKAQATKAPPQNSAAQPANDKSIKSSKVTSDDAKDFLP